MAKNKKSSAPPYDAKKPAPPEIDNRELLELSLSQLTEIKEFMASREALANLETRMTDKIHQELKPLRELRGEFRTFSRVFYGAVAAAAVVGGAVVAALFKIAFPG